MASGINWAERYLTTTGFRGEGIDGNIEANTVVCNTATVTDTLETTNLIVSGTAVLPIGANVIVGSGHLRYMVNPDPTLDVRANNPTMPVDETPATGPYQWVRVVDSAPWIKTPGTVAMWTEDAPVGWTYVGTPGDEHVIIDEPGMWLINLYMRGSSDTITFEPLDIDFGIGVTPPPGAGPTIPGLEGFATGSLTAQFVAAAANGICHARFVAGTRLDFYVKCESSRGLPFPGGIVNLILEQNGSIQFTRIGA
jgi:hypothetical protein